MPRRCRPLSVARLAVTAFAAALLLALLPVSFSTRAIAQTTRSQRQSAAAVANGNPANPPTLSPGNATHADQAPPPGDSQRRRASARRRSTAVRPASAPATPASIRTNRSKRQRTAKVPDPGSTLAPSDSTFDAVPAPPPQVSSQPPLWPPPLPPVVYPARAASRPGATLPPPPDQLPISNPPAEVHPLSAANRPGAVLPIPPAIYFQASASTPPPGTPLPNTLPLGTVPQHTLPIAGGDPYEALGIKAGSFLILPAVELSAGYDNNPQHAPGGPGSAYYVVAPELHVRSDWSRHSLTADIVGSYTAYSNELFTPSLNHPYLNAKVDGRIDVTRYTQILLEGRAIVSTDNPGSPNIQAGLAKLPIDTTVGGTLGVAEAIRPFRRYAQRHRRPLHISELATDRRRDRKQ